MSFQEIVLIDKSQLILHEVSFETDYYIAGRHTEVTTPLHRQVSDLSYRVKCRPFRQRPRQAGRLKRRPCGLEPMGQPLRHLPSQQNFNQTLFESKGSPIG